MSENANKANIEAAITNIFAGILSDHNQKISEIEQSLSERPEFAPLQEAIKKLDFDVISYIYQRPVELLTEALIKSVWKNNNDLVFLITNSTMLKRMLSQLFQQFEGSSCSVDKAAAVMRRLAVFFAHGKEITFDPNSQYTYSHPSLILKQHDDIVAFFNAVRRLQHGYFDAYMTEMLKISKQASQLKED